jgi:hypothetical protein
MKPQTGATGRGDTILISVGDESVVGQAREREAAIDAALSFNKSKL